MYGKQSTKYTTEKKQIMKVVDDWSPCCYDDAGDKLRTIK